jgi:N-terminal acetyltransferase B complex non-catalytic subunit
MRTLLYKLAHRLITSSPSPSHLSPDRFHLHISILRKLELYDEAHALLASDVGKQICATSLLCNEVRRDIWRLKGLWKEEGMRAEEKIIENK